jgi:hypothetical protein
LHCSKSRRSFQEAAMTNQDGTGDDRAARLLFARYSQQSPRWSGLSWESLREDTRRLFRREAEWSRSAES